MWCGACVAAQWNATRLRLFSRRERIIEVEKSFEVLCVELFRWVDWICSGFWRRRLEVKGLEFLCYQSVLLSVAQFSSNNFFWFSQNEKQIQNKLWVILFDCLCYDFQKLSCSVYTIWQRKIICCSLANRFENLFLLVDKLNFYTQFFKSQRFSVASFWLHTPNKLLNFAERISSN